MAIGCVEGLWIGDICDSQCERSAYTRWVWFLTRNCIAFHRILPLRMIRQCAVLEEFGIFLILAHNVRLFCSAQFSCPDMIPL